MEKKFDGLRYYVEHVWDSSITILLEDKGVFTSGGPDEYIIDIDYKQVFEDEYLYEKDSIESVINAFCDKVDDQMYNVLPNWDEFKDYQEIEGYKECMKAAREACIKPLTKLWNQSQEA